jgi:KaiC/GvpD/RAD55 family RecA-like ATPase
MDGDERVKTGIKGFDQLVEGGIPVGANVLVTGTPGTGKTIFGMQYIYNGAKNGENGVYVTLDEKKPDLIGQAKALGWDIEKLEKAGKLTILEIPLDKAGVNIFEMIEKAVKKIGAKRLVLDSLVNFAVNVDQFVIPLNYKMSDIDPVYKISNPNQKLMYEGKSERRITYLLLNELSKLGTTNLITTAAKPGSDLLTVDGVSEFVADGVVHMHSVEGEEDFNTLNVLKMRITKVKRGVYNFHIGNGGITLKTD